MTKFQIAILITFLTGLIIGIILHCLVQNQVCAEIADLMQSKKKYTILSGCRWDMPIETEDLPTK